jgi:hypothetical protein
MAALVKLSLHFTYFIMLFVIFDKQYRYLKEIDCCQLWNGAVEMHIGREMSNSALVSGRSLRDYPG